MAKATVTRTEAVVTLTMSEAEAIVLLNLTMRVAGPFTGPRGLCGNISAALQEARVPIEAQHAATGRGSVEYVSTVTRVP